VKVIAVLITCHNRQQKTLACLDALFRSSIPDGYSLAVFLVDDGSTDGTALEVHQRYPHVNISKGNGCLYWNGGMRVAFAAAMERGCDYYLWLNDDTLLYSTAIQELIATARHLRAARGKGVIVVGSTQDAVDGKLTYGGFSKRNRWKPIGFEMVQPRDIPIECTTMNGNCVLIPREIVDVVGNLEPKFAHAMGDQDYGLRARYAGFDVWVLPGFAGTCSRNATTGSFKDTSLPVAVRLRKMMEPKGLPLASWRIFTQRHAGFFWPVFWTWPYLKVVLAGFGKMRRT
jgi:GT2 family glycosyltransferase